MRMLAAWLALAASLATAWRVDAEVVDFPAEHPQRVLFVGNSYLYYNDSLHNHVRRMLEAQGEANRRYEFKSATISGASLDEHPFSHLIRARRLGLTAPFELVVIQGGSAETLSPETRRDFDASVRRMVRTARRRGVDPALYMTHAYVEPHARARSDMIDIVARAYIEVGERNGVPVIPVGLGFAESYRRRPGLELHKTFDGSHPNLAGTYLASAIVLKSIYRVDLSRVEYRYFGVLDEEIASYLREVAADVVNEHFGRQP